MIHFIKEREMNAYCNFAGIGLIPWGPVAGGHLCRPIGSTSSARLDANKERPQKFSDSDKAIISRVEEVAKQNNWSMAQVALAWINDKVASPIVGFSSV